MEDWRERARKAGLSQVMIAKLTGVHPNTVSRQLRGEWKMPGYVKSIIVAWELMTEEQRRLFVENINRPGVERI
jgi:IS30 family transposase